MGDVVPDKRVDWIRDRVVPLLKSRNEFFDKMLNTEDGELVRRFCNEEGVTKMFFVAGAKDMMVSEHQPDDKQTKKKCVFALKLAEVKFDEKKVDDMFDKCVVADLSPAVLSHFYQLLRSVYLPVLSNADNTRGWPEVVMKSFTDKYNWMLAAVDTAIGQTKGQTSLWLPPVDVAAPNAQKDKSDKDRVHILESAVVMWTERINTVRRARVVRAGAFAQADGARRPDLLLRASAPRVRARAARACEWFLCAWPRVMRASACPFS